MRNTVAFAHADSVAQCYNLADSDAKCNSDGNAIGDTISHAESFGDCKSVGHAERNFDAFSYAYTECYSGWLRVRIRVLEEPP